MNTEQQKQHTKVTDRLKQEMDSFTLALHSLESKAISAHEAEVSKRGEEIARLEALIAKMIDDETIFRRRAITLLGDESRERDADLAFSILEFIQLPWWKRWLWAVIGYRALQWFPTPHLAKSSKPLWEPPQSSSKSYRSEKPQ